MQKVDSLVSARWVIPVEPEDAVLPHHTVAIRDGRIIDCLPTDQAERQYEAGQHQRLARHALLPGLVNAHTHNAMSLLRGLADDLPLMTWLQDHIWPAEGRHVSPEFVHDGTALAMAEMLRGGTTCFSDMYFFPEVTGRLADRVGMRAVLGMIVIDMPTPYGSGPEDYLDKGVALHDAWRNHPHISTVFAPHAPYTVSPEWLKRVRVLADQLDTRVHMHVHETAGEVEDCVQSTGQRPLQRLDQLGLLNPSLIAVHMTQLTEAEMDRLAETGVNVVHCPESNLKLGSGFCPVHALQRRGIHVAIGTDGAASNNDLDLLGELRTAALLAKGYSGNPAALPAHRALRMATLDGARVLGLDGEIGSLVPGKYADLCAVDLSGVETEPLYNPISQLVYTGQRERVSHVWVAGRLLLNERRLTTLNEADILERTRAWQARIAPEDTHD
ncbi:TRZ/ATZ family hydrolase [Alkalilimnicola ehrlichii MLHE-1]|uniref:5-methylthioadenosine/S-adenosylhomocysteine deaminase n=1 Tax=Alkalilimnicola ehrlichii (strain ATCC BAA-1101 / DSM 17681 / MLHE-1) TaxID=187272 RepID=Q0AA72_ALKEH|nr:TRZ/ATZ family hydrolase [Alkalilimnicola ehrlichii]ABI56265.1 amidohydrolase [Alkalilimnicola ehrlichii MLHE-1]